MINSISIPVLMAIAASMQGQSIISRAEAPPSFQEQLGHWRIAGDIDAGGCVALRDADQATTLTVAADPKADALTFLLQNSSWRSIEHFAAMRVKAHFLNKSGRITDSWSLDAIGVNDQGGKPGFRFTINRAKNDSSSFTDQFSSSDRIAFFNGDIPLAVLSLAGSMKALEALRVCRTQLRIDPSFDPFAK